MSTNKSHKDQLLTTDQLTWAHQTMDKVKKHNSFNTSGGVL